MRFSVIVPVYNVEAYLPQCVNSILSQNFKDFELILVDDGSPDNCPKICDEYAKKDNRVKVIHKQNGGLSSARNTGVEVAQGEYLIFIDSDDFYEGAEFLKKLDKVITENNADVAVYSMKLFYNNNKNYIPSSVIFTDPKWNSFNSYEQTVTELLKENKFIVSACSNAVKREFFLEKQLFFKKGIFSEDIEWAMRMYSNELRLAFLKDQPYICRADREGSITSDMKEKNFIDLFSIIEQNAEKFSKSNSSIEKLLLNYITYQYVILCGIIVRAKDKKFKKEFIRKLVKYKWLMKYDMCPKVKKAKKIYSTLGFYAMTKVLGLYIKYGR